MNPPPPLDTNPYWSIDQAAGTQYVVPPELLSAQQWYESGWEPAGPVSSAGAEGIAQFLPGTAAAYGVTNPFDPAQEIPAEAKYLSDAEKLFGNWPSAVSSYDAGVGAVQANGGKVLADTSTYVNNVIGAAAAATPSATLTGSGSPWNPLTIIGEGAGVVVGGGISAAQGLGLLPSTKTVESEILRGGTYLSLLAGGIGLVVAGVWKMANPGTTIRQSAKNVVSNIQSAVPAAGMAE
jgi:hypothetical protein